MKTMAEVIRDRFLDVCGEQLRALRSAVPVGDHAQLTITITREMVVTSATVHAPHDQNWYTTWGDLPEVTRTH